MSVMKARKPAVVALLAAMGFAVTGLPAEAQQKRAARGCVDYSNDPAGCQPSTFATPTGQIPSRRVGKDGKLNARSTEAEARAGAARVEKALHLFRNIEPVHWVATVPSVKDPATGDWTGGDLDAMGDARGLGIAGSCIFVGHENGLGQKHGINIFRIRAPFRRSGGRERARRAGEQQRAERQRDRDAQRGGRTRGCGTGRCRA